MKTGWLVVNGFLHSRKFEEIYGFLLDATKKLGAELSVVPSDSLFPLMASGFLRQNTSCDGAFRKGKTNVGASCTEKAVDGFVDVEKPDFVLFWDKDVTLAKLLEKFGFRLFNNAHAIEICDSKVLTALELSGKVPTPQTLISPKTFLGVGYTNLRFVEKAAAILGLPMIIKEAYGSFGQQVYLAKTIDEAKALVLKLAGTDFVMQRFVSESSGRDIRLNVVGGKAVNAILRQSHGDFRSNITLGGNAERYEPTAEEVAVAERACQIVGCDFAGVDVLFGSDGPLVCEINSNLHFKTTFDATGVNIGEHIVEYVLDCV